MYPKAFRRFVLDMLQATRLDGLEHMAFHFTKQAMRRKEDMAAYLADNQDHTHSELREAFAVLLAHYEQAKEGGR